MNRALVHKHETVTDRQQRHAADVEASLAPRGLRKSRKHLHPIDVDAWDAMHREAEQQTIFRPLRREDV